MDAIKESLAAGAATLPCYTYWIKKAAQQTGTPLPKFGWREACSRTLIEGVPVTALIVGSQLLVQNELESRITPFLNRKDYPFLFPGISSFTTGVITSPILAFYNLLTIKKTGETYREVAKCAITKLTARQTIAFAARETAFLYSMRILRPLEELMEDSESLAYISAFASGYFCSILSHPFDTYTTLKSNEIPLVDLAGVTKSDSPLKMGIKYTSLYMRGWKPRALGIAIFVTTFRFTNQCIGNK